MLGRGSWEEAGGTLRHWAVPQPPDTGASAVMRQVDVVPCLKAAALEGGGGLTGNFRSACLRQMDIPAPSCAPCWEMPWITPSRGQGAEDRTDAAEGPGRTRGC